MDCYAIRKDASQNRINAPALVDGAFGSTCAERMDRDLAAAAVLRIVRVLHVLDEPRSRSTQERSLLSVGSIEMVLASLCLDLPASADVASSLVGTAVALSLHRNPCACGNVHLSGGHRKSTASIAAFGQSHYSGLSGTVSAQSRTHLGRLDLNLASAKT